MYTKNQCCLKELLLFQNGFLYGDVIVNGITNTTESKCTPQYNYTMNLQNVGITLIQSQKSTILVRCSILLLSCRGNTNFRLIALENFRQFSRWVYCLALSVLCWKVENIYFSNKKKPENYKKKIYSKSWLKIK